MQVYDTLVISGGGVKGFCHLGALSWLFDRKILDYETIQTFAGCSIGGAISLLLICGCKPIELLRMYSQLDFLERVWKGVHLDYKILITNKGFLDSNVVFKEIKEIVLDRFGFIPTLKELYELTGKKFMVSVCNVNQECVEYLDFVTDPMLSCIEAVKMTCAIPFLFQAISYKSSWYVDGGLLDPFPIRKVDDGTRRILGLATDQTVCKKSERSQTSDIGALDFFQKIVFLPGKTFIIEACERASEMCTIIKIPTMLSSVKFKLDEDEKFNLFLLGRQSARLEIEGETLVL